MVNVTVELTVRFRADNMAAAHRYAQTIQDTADRLYQQDHELSQGMTVDDTVTLELTISG